MSASQADARDVVNSLSGGTDLWVGIRVGWLKTSRKTRGNHELQLCKRALAWALKVKVGKCDSVVYLLVNAQGALGSKRRNGTVIGPSGGFRSYQLEFSTDPRSHVSIVFPDLKDQNPDTVRIGSWLDRISGDWKQSRAHIEKVHLIQPRLTRYCSCPFKLGHKIEFDMLFYSIPLLCVQHARP